MSDFETYHVKDPGIDILSHQSRRDSIHILTLDRALADDVCERIHEDTRMKDYELVRPKSTAAIADVTEIEQMAAGTVSSRLLIFDVRRITLTRLQQAYNKVVGYNRRDLNKLCYIILIGDGPVNLFRTGKCLDAFVPYLAVHRVDYYPAAFFYDPFLHYEPEEMAQTSVEHPTAISNKIPKRLAYYFKGQVVTTDDTRKYFRATGKDEETKQKRLKVLTDLYKKRIDEQFKDQQCDLDAWLTKEGIQLAGETLHMYPLFFEDWVHELVQKAQQESDQST
ncbi:MAG: hypothetical protein PVG93_01935 [Phycisphaerales bacterium]